MSKPSPVNFPIDLVFTWVDGSDPAYAARRATFGHLQPEAPARWYQGVDEITFAVRSALRHMPWLRHIFIVTDDQTPPVDEALIVNGRVKIVSHASIIPQDYRPVFASTIIESFLYRIPDLSEIFLYANDDFFAFADADPIIFVTASGDLVLRARRAWPRRLLALIAHQVPFILNRWIPRINPYTAGIANSFRVARQLLSLTPDRVFVPRHVTQVYRRATLEKLEILCSDALHDHRARRFRTHDQLSYATLAYSAEVAWYAKTELRLGSDPAIATFDFLHRRTPRDCDRVWHKIKQCQAPLTCINGIPFFEKERFKEMMRAKGYG